MNDRSCLVPALGLFVCSFFHASLLAQTTDWPSTAMPPLVLRDTRPDEWPDLRGRIETRLKRYPDVAATFSAVHNAWMVWHLLGAPNHVNVLIHGDGHDTVDEVRDTAYGWIERWLPVKNPAAKPAAAP